MNLHTADEAIRQAEGSYAAPRRTDDGPLAKGDRFDQMLVEERALPQTTQCLAVRQWDATAGSHHGLMPASTDLLADEVPVALVYNGISHAVMLASPDHLEDFALGFSLSESIVDQRADIYDIEVVVHELGIEIRMHLAAGAMHRLKSSRRMRTGKTGCGLCGIESLEQFDSSSRAVPYGGSVTANALQLAMAGLAALQYLHDSTGAAHAAGWASRNGAVLLAREDVGRHNALDKLIGAMAHHGIAGDGGFAVVTSRQLRDGAKSCPGRHAAAGSCVCAHGDGGAPGRCCGADPGRIRARPATRGLQSPVSTDIILEARR